MARQDAGAQAEDAGCGGPGQQDGAHCLGSDDDEAEIPGTCRRLIGRHAAGSRRGCGQDGGRVRANGQ